MFASFCHLPAVILLLLEAMDAHQLKLSIERILTAERYPSNPVILKFSHSEWDAWLKQRCRQTNWRLKHSYKSGNYSSVIFLLPIHILQPIDPKSTRRCQVLWSERYECDHAGMYRNLRTCNSVQGREEIVVHQSSAAVKPAYMHVSPIAASPLKLHINGSTQVMVCLLH